MKSRLLLLFLLAAAAPATAQAPPELTLDAAVRQALHQHPALDLAQANVARAASGVRDAQSSRLPSLSLDANLTRFQEPMVVAPLHGLDLQDPPKFDRTLSQGTATLGYTLFDAARGARVDRAEALEQAAQSGSVAARMQVLADVTRAFLRVRTAREVGQAHERRSGALREERDRAAQLVEQGRAARVVLLRAEAALSAAIADEVAARSDVDVAENELARLLNVRSDSIRTTPLTAVRPLPGARPNVMQLRAAAREHNPDLTRAQRQISAAEATRGEARGLRLPKLQLGGRYIEYASSTTDPQGEWQGSVQLSYPVFTGGARGAAHDRANAEIRAAVAEYDLAVRRVDDAIDRATAAHDGARARVAALAAAVAQSEEVTRIDRLALDAGAGVQSDYLTAEADLFRSRAALTEARALEVMALIELARASGQLSESWIAQNVESYR
jgi:outer membrane protein TolC